jgi:High-affinity nickel-transport protein
MFGLDDHIASLGSGEAFLIVAIIAVLLGLRHATDPDHLTAVSTLVAGERADSRSAGRLGLAWGLGHATTLFLFGLPIVLYRSYLPAAVQAAAETLIGLVIVALAVRLLVRWRASRSATHAHAHGARSPLQAYGIGLVHGLGGSAGVGVLLLAGIPDHVEAVAALALFAAFTAVSMALASTSFGWVLSRGAVQRSFVAVAPAMAGLSMAFGVWYALGAVQAVPYVF